MIFKSINFNANFYKIPSEWAAFVFVENEKTDRINADL